MKLYCWYTHSWYFNPTWFRTLEIGYDLRAWGIGAYCRNGDFGLFLGPIIIDFGLSF